jgi:hypothetical protein
MKMNSKPPLTPAIISPKLSFDVSTPTSLFRLTRCRDATLTCPSG